MIPHLWDWIKEGAASSPLFFIENTFSFLYRRHSTAEREKWIEMQSSKMHTKMEIDFIPTQEKYVILISLNISVSFSFNSFIDQFIHSIIH